MKKTILGSHNSWSFLPPKHWWQKPFGFMAKCQDLNIQQQYEAGVRCFDLRIRFNEGDTSPIVCHGKIEYDISPEELYSNLRWLNGKKNVYIRVIHEARTNSQYSAYSKTFFRMFCDDVTTKLKNIKFWCGRSLYNWKNPDYEFKYSPSCKEKYSSVCAPKWIDDWIPRFYAKYHNPFNLRKEYDEDILLIDFVNYK